MKKIGIALLVSILLVLMAVPVQADNINYTTIRGKGRTYYLSIEFNRKYQMRSRLYQKTSSGKKVVAATGFANENRLEYVGTYGNKLYFSYKYNTRIRTYSYTIGKSGFKLENGSLYLQAMRGNYAYGYRQIPDDNSPTKLYIYMLRPENQHTLAWDTSLISNILEVRSITCDTPIATEQRIL